MKKIPILLVLILFGCKVVPIKRELRTVSEIATLNNDQKYLKAHLKDGRVYVLSEWTFDRVDSVILGYGAFLDINRKVIEKKESSKTTTGQKLRVPIASVAVIETNDPGTVSVGGLVFVTGLSGALTLLCITNPKACFGSCPTFYANDGDTLKLMAEGFSTSVSPSLEKNDIDMLYHAQPTEKFELTVTNEALETHNIRHANVLVLPRGVDQRVFCTPASEFFACDNFQPALGESSFNHETRHADGEEYFSLTDEHDLNTQEEVLLSFPNATAARKGLVIGKRQTLLTTFLMYQGLSYMGRSVGYWLGEMERGAVKPEHGVFRILGGIEIFLQTKGGWEKVNEINETGPIATDFSLIPLPDAPTDTLRIKLRMTKGLWRLDYVSLVDIHEPVQPQIVKPSQAVTLRGNEPHPLARLLNDKEFLVTYPGEAFKITYNLPNVPCDLFLDSKGFYLEWIREQWEREQNLRALKLMVSRPYKYLDKAAEWYKKLEPSMEETFWKSRYVQK